MTGGSRARGKSDVTIALIYTRVSSEDQAREGVSLDAQLAECRRYIAALGFVLGDEFQDVMSGKRDDRPRYQDLLAEARRLRAAGKDVAVVVSALDRLGRRLMERVRCREELKGLGVPTHSIREGGVVPDLISNVLASVAEEESRRLGERLSRTFDHIRSQGWKKPGKCMWGYRWRPATADERAQGAPKSALEPDPLTAPYVRELFERLADRQSLRSVVRWVADLPEVARGGNNLSFRTLQGTVHSPVYVARPYHPSDVDVLDRPVQRWPAIVADDLFRRVQARLGNGVLRPQATGRFLLTGLIRCAACGARMYGFMGTRNKVGTPRYQCHGWMLGANGATCNASVSGKQIDGLVLAEVDAILGAIVNSDEDLIAEVRRAWTKLTTVPGNEHLRERLAKLRGEVAMRRETLTRAVQMYVSGDLDRAGYERLRERTQSDLEALDAEIGRLQGVTPAPAVPPFETVLSQVGGWSSAVREADTPDKREVLACLIERVVPHREDGHYRLDVTWTPLGKGLRDVAAAVRPLPLDCPTPFVGTCVACGGPVEADPRGKRIAPVPRQRCNACRKAWQRQLKAESHRRRYAATRAAKLARRYPCRTCSAEIGPRIAPSGRVGVPALCEACSREERQVANRRPPQKRR